MEGPTPVSAMIHAATMVSAGVYMVIRMFPLISAGWLEGQALNPTMTVIAFIGAFTALFAATIAVAQNDIKRVLAYSTISQLGYMMAALGVGAYVAAGFHLVTHAFFKALLFLLRFCYYGMEHGVLHTSECRSPEYVHWGLRKRYVTFGHSGRWMLSGFRHHADFGRRTKSCGAFGHGQLAVFSTHLLAAFLNTFYAMRQIP
jgi:NADH-quinone oxidoreductase subunit L